MNQLTLRLLVATITLAALCLAGPAARAQDDVDPPGLRGETPPGGETSSADTTKQTEPPPKHGIERATDEDKKVYEAAKARVMKSSARQVESLKGKAGFGLSVGTEFGPVLEACLWGYRYSGDTAWLEKFAELMTALEGTLTEDPDGRKGWYSGPAKRVFGEPWPASWPDTSQVTAWQHAEARVIAACADFEMLIRSDQDLKDAYVARAKGWTTLAHEVLIPKWESCYAEMSQDRAVYTWPKEVFTPGKAGWSPWPGNPTERAGLTLPHWATSEIILRDLKMWQLTDRKSYRTRAAKLLRWQKSCLRFYRGGRPNQRFLYGGKPDTSTYFWYHWDPSDVTDFRTEGGLGHGMYLSLRPLDYARDVEAFVEGYHAGTVIDKDDIRRLVETQVKRMMSGDATNPTWRDQRGEKRGMLWPMLAEFDERIDTLVTTTFDPADLEFGGKLRFMHDRYWWGDWKQRKMGSAERIDWNMTHEEFREEMDRLIREHPAPDPRQPRGR